MKRDFDNLNLRNAFKPMPDECRNALMTAACSVKEEEPVKRVTIRTVLIAACIIIATMAIAMAAGQIFGWTDFLSGNYDVTVPRDAEQAMKNNGEITRTVGPVTFTIGGLYCDGYTATASAVARTADGSDALITDEAYSSVGATGEDGEQAAERLGVDPDTTWIDAAQQLNLPLYSIRAVLEIPEEYAGSEQMESAMFNEDGSVTYFSMAPMDGKITGEKVDCNVRLRVAEINVNDPEAEEEAIWESQPVSIRLESPLDVKEYTVPENSGVDNALRLDSVKAVQMPAGIYLLADYTALNNIAKQTFWSYYGMTFFEFIQADGGDFPTAMDLSGCGVIDQLDDWPVIRLEQMISADSIPETICIRLPDKNRTILKLNIKK